MGGVFKHTNSNLYAYGANSPVCYTDPTGSELIGWIKGFQCGWNDNAPQTAAGYHSWMDTASIALFNIDHAEIDMGIYTIRFWKGDYGSAVRLTTGLFSVGMAGGEVGLYNNDGRGLGNDGGSLMSPSDLDGLGITNITLNVNNKDGKNLASVTGKRAWPNAYNIFNHSKKSNLYTETTISFETQVQATSFANQFNKNKKGTDYEGQLTVKQDGANVTITWGKNNDD